MQPSTPTANPRLRAGHAMPNVQLRPDRPGRAARPLAAPSLFVRIPFLPLLRALLPAVLALSLAAGCTPRPAPQSLPPLAVLQPRLTPQDALDRAAQRPPELRALLQRLPKGADLHSHLTGAVYAESYLAWAAADGDCVDTATGALTPPPCNATGRAPAAAAMSGSPLRTRALRALSMYPGTAFSKTGAPDHDRFFATFGNYAPVSHNPVRVGDMLAEVRSRAGHQNELYLELISGLAGPGVKRIARAAKLTTGPDDPEGLSDAHLAATRQRLLDAGLARSVAESSAFLDRIEARARKVLACDGDAPDPGCGVTVRYIAQVNRLSPPAETFADLVFAQELARRDERVVAATLVAPEDDPRALANYRAHMRLVGYLARTGGDAMAIHLHAGELALGLVPPRELRFHVREAVDVALARRIGHGVDVMDEDGAADLLARMAERRVAVEILLTSNEQILGVTGADHPLRTYLAHGVPVVLSTDDEGVERTDLTNEYVRAVREHGLTYAQLKTVSRNGLEYAFLRGQSLWAEPYARAAEPCRAAAQPAPEGQGGPFPQSLQPSQGAQFPQSSQLPQDSQFPQSSQLPQDSQFLQATPSAACAAFLAANPKARLQWELEQRFATFERDLRQEMERDVKRPFPAPPLSID
jgi:hypothetical protein